MWFEFYVLRSKYRILLEKDEMDGSFNGQNVHCAVETKVFYITWINFLTVGSLPQ
jgi:hypothetical protein